MCIIRCEHEVTNDFASIIYICLSSSSGFLASALEDAVWKLVYFFVSSGVIFVLLFAPGMGIPTGAGNSTVMGNRTQISNSSMGGPASVQHSVSWDSQGSAQNFALLIAP